MFPKELKTSQVIWWLVQDVADLYSHYYSEAKVNRAETAILAPLGLNRATFIERQQQMSSSLVNQLAHQMVNYELPAVEAIITGADPTGPHIYVAENSEISCEDMVGFASIGVGRWHANSQFMFAGHTRNSSLTRTAYLTFSAKRRAEVAPGVGAGTDLFIISGLGGYTPIGTHVLDALDKAYKSNQKGINKSSKKAEEGFAKYLEQLSESQAPPAQKAGGDSERPAEAGTASKATPKPGDGTEKEGEAN